MHLFWLRPTAVSLLAVLLCALAPAARPDPPPVELEDPLVPLEPRRTRSEAEQDHLEAAAHFAHARLLVQRGQEHEALDQYERAWRYGPQGAIVAREIIALASRLQRHGEATRYAVLAAERHPHEFPLLTQLGMLLVRQGQVERGRELLERALTMPLPAEGSASQLAVRVELGRLYLLGDQPADAARHFAAVQRAMQNPAAAGIEQQEVDELLKQADAVYALMGESFLEAGQLEQAEEAFAALQRHKADANLDTFHQARLAAARQQGDAARSLLDDYFRRGATVAGSDAFDLLRRLMDQAEDAGTDRQQAEALLEVLEPLADTYAEDAAYQYARAAALQQAEQLDAAVAAWQRGIELQPTRDAYLALAELLYKNNQPQAYLDLLARILSRTSSLSAIREQVDQLSAEEEFVRQLTATAGDHPRQAARLAATLVAIALHKPEAADTLLEATLAAEMELNRHDILQQVALGFFLANEPARSARVFRQAIATDPPAERKALNYYYLAGAEALAQQSDAALEAAQEAAQLNPTPRFKARPAWVLYHARRYDDARQQYRALLEEYQRDYSSEEIRDVVRGSKLVLSNLAVLQDRTPEAEEWLEQVLDEFPEDVSASNDLGYLWADQGKHLERSLRMIQHAVQADPDNAAYRDSLGWVLLRLGRYDESIAELEKAAAGENPDGVILDHLGDAYLESGQLERARQAWQRAIDAFEQDDDQKALEQTKAKLTTHSTSPTRP